MNFLPPAFVRCETCEGCRFDPRDSGYRISREEHRPSSGNERGRSARIFRTITKIRRPLEALRDTGLGYIQLGQISPTLSGGEAQRMKLVTHLLTGLKEPRDLFDPLPRHNLFVLEEPTIGLHMADVKRLVEVFQRLVDAGHSVIVIEHNLDSDRRSRLGYRPGARSRRRRRKARVPGTPEQVAANPDSHTGRFLGTVLE